MRTEAGNESGTVKCGGDGTDGFIWGGENFGYWKKVYTRRRCRVTNAGTGMFLGSRTAGNRDHDKAANSVSDRPTFPNLSFPYWILSKPTLRYNSIRKILYTSEITSAGTGKRGEKATDDARANWKTPRGHIAFVLWTASREAFGSKANICDTSRLLLNFNATYNSFGRWIIFLHSSNIDINYRKFDHGPDFSRKEF